MYSTNPTVAVSALQWLPTTINGKTINMSNPWMKKNPFMSMWLSGANSVAGTARNQMKAHGTRLVTDFWRKALTPNTQSKKKR